MRDERLLPAAEVVERALAASPANDCIAIVTERFDADQRFANNTTTTNGVRRDRQVSVASFHAGPDGISVGVASRSGAGEVADLVHAAEAASADAPAAEDASPLVGSTVSGDFADPPAETSLDALGGVLAPLRDAFARAAASGRVLAGFARHEVETVYLGTSSGVRRRYVQPTGTLELVARDTSSGSAWVGAGTADFADVDLEEMNARLAQRLDWSARRVELPAGRYEVVLPPDAVADLLVVLYEAASARDARDGRSVFSGNDGSTRLGERLAGLPLELRSDPDDAELACPSFLVTPSSGPDVSVFDNGANLDPTRWLGAGHLEALREHRAAAREHGTAFTAPIDNLRLELPGATATLEELVANTRRGLLLTCLWYIREVDAATLLLTGLTRDGVYLVEDGEVVGAVNNFRFNESPVGLLGRVLEAGVSERALSREWGEWMSRTAMASLRVAEFNMSSVSPAS